MISNLPRPVQRPGSGAVRRAGPTYFRPGHESSGIPAVHHDRWRDKNGKRRIRRTARTWPRSQDRSGRDELRAPDDGLAGCGRKVLGDGVLPGLRNSLNQCPHHDQADHGSDLSCAHRMKLPGANREKGGDCQIQSGALQNGSLPDHRCVTMPSPPGPRPALTPSRPGGQDLPARSSASRAYMPGATRACPAGNGRRPLNSARRGRREPTPGRRAARARGSHRALMLSACWRGVRCAARRGGGTIWGLRSRRAAARRTQGRSVTAQASRTAAETVR